MIARGWLGGGGGVGITCFRAGREGVMMVRVLELVKLFFVYACCEHTKVNIYKVY